jgi:hypothetical protein
MDETEALASLAAGTIIRLCEENDMLIRWNSEMSLRHRCWYRSDERNQSESKSERRNRTTHGKYLSISPQPGAY